MLLQIIHIRESHWAAIKMVNNKEVLLYDSAYTTISMDTVDIITKLIHCMESAATIHVMNVAKQAGMTDCALFAMATITCLAMGTDPLAVVPDQQELRSHLLNILVTGKVAEFPTIKKRRIVSQIRKTEEFQVHCYAACGMMVQKWSAVTTVMSGTTSDASTMTLRLTSMLTNGSVKDVVRLFYRTEVSLLAYDFVANNLHELVHLVNVTIIHCSVCYFSVSVIKADHVATA